MLIFTDLDGTLLNRDDYAIAAALPTLARLQQANIPIIPTTSKTRAEVSVLRQQIDLHDPFIVENGSGLFLSAKETRFDLQGTESMEGGDRQVTFGCSYGQARSGLEALGLKLGLDLVGFGDLSLDEIVGYTDLPRAEAAAAAQRDFSEPFLEPEGIDTLELDREAEALGLHVLVGNRFCHLLGKGADKGRAARWLMAAWQGKTPVKTLGLGDSPNDLALLDVVDIPIVVPGPDGPHPLLADRGWAIAPEPGCLGWALAVEDQCKRLAITLPP